MVITIKFNLIVNKAAFAAFFMPADELSFIEAGEPKTGKGIDGIYSTSVGNISKTNLETNNRPTISTLCVVKVVV
jgi:hypothetical protein